jgi:hypothetical protein
MAQPIYFDNFGRALRAKAAAAPYEAGAQAIQGITGMVEKVLFAQQARQEADKVRKMAAMDGMVKAGMGPSMGPSFAADYQKTTGIQLPLGADGQPTVPGKPVEMKPTPSQTEITTDKELAKFVADAKEKSAALDRASAEKIAGIQAIGTLGAANANINAKKDAATLREGKRDARQQHLIDARAGQQLTGSYVDSAGNDIPAVDYHSNPGAYPGAYQLTADMLKARHLDTQLRNSDAKTLATIEHLHRQLEYNVSKVPELVRLFGEAAKMKNEPLMSKIISAQLTSARNVGNISLSDKQIQDLASNPAERSFLSSLFFRAGNAQGGGMDGADALQTPAPQGAPQPNAPTNGGWIKDPVTGKTFKVEP